MSKPLIYKRVNLRIHEVEIDVVCPVDGTVFRIDDDQVHGLKAMVCPNGDYSETHDISDDYPDKETVLEDGRNEESLKKFMRRTRQRPGRP